MPIQLALLDDVHEQPALTVTFTDVLPPPLLTFWLAGENRIGASDGLIDGERPARDRQRSRTARPRRRGGAERDRAVATEALPPVAGRGVVGGSKLTEHL